jgi:hypothetical protein
LLYLSLTNNSILSVHPDTFKYTSKFVSCNSPTIRSPLSISTPLITTLTSICLHQPERNH